MSIMSSESLAIFRKNPSADLHKLADQHIQHEYGAATLLSCPLSPEFLLLIPSSLQPVDRETLKTAARKIPTHTSIGSVVGLGIGLLLAQRVRSKRLQFFQTFRAIQKPTHVKFADGREGMDHIHLPFLHWPCRPEISPHRDSAGLGCLIKAISFQNTS